MVEATTDALRRQTIADARCAVLGSILIDSRCAGEVFRALAPDDFGTGVARQLFDAANRLYITGRPIDPVTVLSEAGGGYEADVLRLMDMTPTAANVSDYCDILREQVALGRLQTAAMAVSSATTLKDAVEAAGLLNGMLADRPGLRRVPLHQGIAEFIARQSNKAAPQYLKFGLEALDKMLYAERGDLIILGGYPSAGKTVLAMQFAWELATRQKMRVAMFSLETKDEKLYDRLMASVLKVSFEDVKRHGLNDMQLADAVSLGVAANNVVLDVYRAGGMRVADIAAQVVAHNYDVVFIDYLQLIRGEGKSRFDQVTDVSLSLHTMSQTTGTAVVALSQLARRDKQSKNKPPTLSDLRESGQIEQDADAVMLIYLDDEDLPGGDRILKIAKNKEGETGFMRLGFYPQHMRFYYKGRASGYKPKSRFKTLPPDEDAAPLPFKGMTGEQVELP